MILNSRLRQLFWLTTISMLLSAPLSADTISSNLLPPLPTEGVPVNNFTLATFTDTNLSTAASDFSASIDWGDGTTSSATITGGSGAFSLLGSHTYADEDPVALTIPLDLNGSLVFTATLIFTPAEADSFFGSPVNLSLAPGQLFSGVVANVTDSFANNVASDFTTTIDWGDGATSPGIIVDIGGAISVSGMHSYSNPGNFNVTTSILDPQPGGGFTEVQTFGNATVAPSTVPEPSTLSLLFGVAAALLLGRSARFREQEKRASQLTLGSIREFHVLVPEGVE